MTLSDYVTHLHIRKGDNDDDEEAEEEMEEGVDPKFLETQRRLQEEARERNRSEFGEEGEAARLRLEGFRAGLYVRLVLKNVPVEFIKVRLSLQSNLPSHNHTRCAFHRQQPHFILLHHWI